MIEMDLNAAIENLIRKSEETSFTKETFLYIIGIFFLFLILLFFLITVGKKTQKRPLGIALERINTNKIKSV